MKMVTLLCNNSPASCCVEDMVTIMEATCISSAFSKGENKLSVMYVLQLLWKVAKVI